MKFATPTVNKINAEGEEDDVISRMLMIERLGGTLKYSDVADKIFRSNLSMIDLHMGRLMAEMTRLMWLDGITKVSELTEEIKKLNPLKIKGELITKHGFSVVLSACFPPDICRFPFPEQPLGERFYGKRQVWLPGT